MTEPVAQPDPPPPSDDAWSRFWNGATGRRARDAGKILLGIFAVIVTVASLRELASREWLQQMLTEKIEATQLSYERQKKPFSTPPAAPPVSATELDADKQRKDSLLDIELEQAAMTAALVILRERVQTLANVGSDRLSRTTQSIADIAEELEHADKLSLARLCKLGLVNFEKRDTWKKHQFIEKIIAATSYRKPDYHDFTSLETNPVQGKDHPCHPGPAKEVAFAWLTAPVAGAIRDYHRLSSDVLLQFLALSLGFLGSCFAVVMTRTQFSLQDAFVGPVFGLLSFFLIKGGKNVLLFNVPADGTSYNHYTVAIVAFAVGLFHEQFRTMLQSLVMVRAPDKTPGADTPAGQRNAPSEYPR